ncbi:MAG: prolyl oligopeptidase family serine peptidase [Candidatus Coatesbacteria bacterium]|nr:prolyl oligopeptidase family serine peptidase [Candidatus Coatesbacteria bacterium]
MTRAHDKMLLLVVLLAVGGAAAAEDSLYLDGMAAYSAGEYDEAAGLLELHYITHPDCPYTAYNAACCCALSGDATKALAYIDRSIELGICSFAGDPDFDTLSGTAAFAERLERADAKLAELQDRDWPAEILPPSSVIDSGRPLLIMLHGFGAAPANLVGPPFGDYFTDEGYLYAVPYGDRVHGSISFSWSGLAEAEDVVERLLERLENEYGLDGESVYLAGFSQGGAVALGLALKRPELFDGVIALAGGWNPAWETYLADAAAADLRCYLWIGELDEAERVSGLETALHSLRAAEVTATLVIAAQTAHSLPADSLAPFRDGLDYVGAP